MDKTILIVANIAFVEEIKKQEAYKFNPTSMLTVVSKMILS